LNSDTLVRLARHTLARLNIIIGGILDVLDFFGLDHGIFVFEALKLEYFFSLWNVLRLDVAGDSQAIHGCTTQSIAKVVHSHLVFVLLVSLKLAEEIDLVFVSVGLEVSKEDYVVVTLKPVVEAQLMALLVLIFTHGDGTIRDPMRVKGLFGEASCSTVFKVVHILTGSVPALSCLFEFVR